MIKLAGREKATHLDQHPALSFVGLALWHIRAAYAVAGSMVHAVLTIEADTVGCTLFTSEHGDAHLERCSISRRPIKISLPVTLYEQGAFVEKRQTSAYLSLIL